MHLPPDAVRDHDGAVRLDQWSLSFRRQGRGARPGFARRADRQSSYLWTSVKVGRLCDGAKAGKWQLTGKIPELVVECGFDEYCMWAYKHNLPPGVKHTGGWEGKPGKKNLPLLASFDRQERRVHADND